MIELLLKGDVMLFSLILFCLIFSLTFHEYGHGIMAKYFGDRTAEFQGRLTLNPVAHIDPMGLLMVIMIGFGFAKPVPTDPRNFRSRWGIFFVAAAGPMMNLLLAFLAVNIYGLGLILGLPLFEGQAANIFFVYLASINMLLMLFNLIPIGPLDGHYILPFFLPTRMARYYQYYNDRYGHWFLLSIIALSLLGVPVFQNIMGLSQSMLRYIILF
jgi:Zn-dependent protease